MPDDKPVTRRTGAASDNPADDTGHPVQPAGQATSPASDAEAKAHQRTGDPETDAADTASDEPDTQRMSLTLPRSTADRIRAHADTNDMTISEAAADLLKAPAGGGPGFHQNY